ncbi:MAG: ABC transporter ATP-binding protein, partial [Spirochaetia bacterium]
MNNTSALVHVEKLYKEFTNGPERLRIIDGISLSIEPGSILVITGSSGSGKSTLLNILGGLERPSSGEIHSCGYILTNAKEEDLNIYRSHSVGFVFQFHHLLKDFNALENVLLPAYMAGKGKNKAQEEAKVLLEDVGLANRMDHYPSQLSGGERQRVALARALINRP